MSESKTIRQGIRSKFIFDYNYLLNYEIIHKGLNLSYLIPPEISNLLAANKSSELSIIYSDSIEKNNKIKPYYTVNNIICSLCREEINDIYYEEFLSCFYCCKYFHYECYEKLNRKFMIDLIDDKEIFYDVNQKEGNILEKSSIINNELNKKLILESCYFCNLK